MRYWRTPSGKVYAENRLGPFVATPESLWRTPTNGSMLYGPDWIAPRNCCMMASPAFTSPPSSEVFTQHTSRRLLVQDWPRVRLTTGTRPRSSKKTMHRYRSSGTRSRSSWSPH